MKLAYPTIALVFAVTTTMASAQTPQPVPQARQAEGPIAQILPTIPANAMTVTHWYKQNVYDPSDNKIGEIMDVLVSPEGRATALIVGVGGFLGAGEKDVAVPFSAVKHSMKDKKIYLTMDTTKDALKAAPGFKYDREKTSWVPDSLAK